MKRTLLIAAAALVAIPLTTAIAAKLGSDHGRHDGHGRIAQVDTNKDGSISAAEAEAARQARFQATDADGDGQISRAEIEARMMARIQSRIDRRIAHTDSDGDGVISREEADAHAAERFARMDKNDDGVLTPDEMRKRHHRHGGHGRHGDKKE